MTTVYILNFSISHLALLQDLHLLPLQAGRIPDQVDKGFVLVCHVDLHPGRRVYCGVVDHISYRPLLVSPSGSLKTGSNSHFREMGK